MKTILLLIICSCLISCTGFDDIKYGDKSYSIEVIDGCEYLTKYNGYSKGFNFTHKGNCKNPIHYKVVHDTIYIVTPK